MQQAAGILPTTKWAWKRAHVQVRLQPWWHLGFSLGDSALGYNYTVPGLLAHSETTNVHGFKPVRL